MELPELISRFRQLKNSLLEAVKSNVEIAAMDGIQVVISRILQSGKDADGNMFRAYSAATIKRKEKKGHYVGYVNFKDTGDMWESTGLVEEQITPTSARVVVKGRDDFAQNKLDWNSFGRTVKKRVKAPESPFKSLYSAPVNKRSAAPKIKPPLVEEFSEGRGDLLRMSKTEVEQIQEDFGERMEEFIINTLEK